MIYGNVGYQAIKDTCFCLLIAINWLALLYYWKNSMQRETLPITMYLVRYITMDNATH